jgi:hypothetical protein
MGFGINRLSMWPNVAFSDRREAMVAIEWLMDEKASA